MTHTPATISRRQLLGGALTLGAAGALAACSGSSTSSSGSSGGSSGAASGTLNVLLMKQAGLDVSQIGKVLAAFKKQNPDVTVKPTYVAYEALHDKIVTSAAAGTYDVVLMDVIWPAEFATKNIVQDVTDRYPSSWKQQMLGGALTTAEYNHKFYGVPWYLDSKYLFYNTAMLKKAGVKESDLATWDDVMKAAKAIQDKAGVAHPIAWCWSQAEALICDFTQLVAAWGGSLVDGSGKLDLTAGPVDTVTWMVNSMHSGMSNPNSTTFLEADVQKTMAQGQAAFGLNWSSTNRDLRDPQISNISKDVGVIRTPAGPSGKGPGVNGGMAMAIPTRAKNVDGAWELMTFMTSKQQTERFAQSALPSWKSVYQDKSVTSTAPALFKAAEEEFANLVLRPTVPAYNAVSTTIQVELQNALLGKKSPQQAMQDATKRGNSQLSG